MFDPNCDSELVIDCTENQDANFQYYFYQALIEYEQQQGPEHIIWTKERIAKFIEDTRSNRETFQCRLHWTDLEYGWMKEYEVITMDKKEVLFYRGPNPKAPHLMVVPRDQYFDFLNRLHTHHGHGGREKMLPYIKSKYHMPEITVDIFLAHCPNCNYSRKSFFNQNLSVRSNVSRKFNVSGQIDIHDYRVCPDGDYKWLLSYMDDATRYLSLRPLIAREAHEITVELMKIFLTFGSPILLYLDDNQDFTAQLTKDLSAMWPEIRVIPRRNHACLKIHIEHELRIWMSDNYSTKWSFGCFVVQNEFNETCDRLVGWAPYKALFGCDPKTRLLKHKIPASVLKTRQLDDYVCGKIYSSSEEEGNFTV